jgi:hypothetical protein
MFCTGGGSVQYAHTHLGKRAGIEPVSLGRQVTAVLGLRFQLQAKQRKTNCCHSTLRVSCPLPHCSRLFHAV